MNYCNIHWNNWGKPEKSVIIIDLRPEKRHEVRTFIVRSPNFIHYTVTSGFQFRSLTLDINSPNALCASKNNWINGT
jgi:hypothetical protein